MRAWTLGYPPAYERAVRMPGNGKAPGGYAFRTRDAAEAYAASHAEAGRYAAWEMELPGTFSRCTSRDWWRVQRARHRWHTAGASPFMPECGVCTGRYEELDCDLTLVVAPFINPDTGKVA